MLVFFIIAISEILLGIFIYLFFDSQRAKKTIFYRKWLDLDAIFFDLEKDTLLIKKANKIVLLFCLFSAFAILMNGLLHIYFSAPDVKDVLVIITIITVLPLRYFYIIMHR